MKQGFNHSNIRIKRAKGLLFLFLLLTANFVLKAQALSRADQLKAVFLYNFTQFVHWPPEALGNNTFIIGVLGTDPFKAYIDSVVRGEKINGLPITVQRFGSINEVRNCQILYVNSANPTAVVKTLDRKSMLTVGSSDDFAKEGGMIRFFIENNKIRLQINLAAAREANLSISSKLLRVSDVIKN